MTVPKVIKHKAIDFFCGAGGMTNGFRKAGIDVIAGIDFDPECKKTYETNNIGSQFILADIKKLSFSEFTQRTKVKRNDANLIFIGCSPCQYWSKIATDKKKSEESKNLLNDFMRFVDYYNPGTVVIENVPGILTKKQESPLNDFFIFLDSKGFRYDKRIINAAHYGVPQSRKRFLLIATRVAPTVKLPAPLIGNLPVVADFIGPDKGFPVLAAGAVDSSINLHATAALSETNLLRIRMTPADGGTRMVYVDDKHLAIPSQFEKKTTFSDTYGRMRWNKPAPTITTKFVSLSNGRFGHPEQDRALSLREGAALQTFDASYQFHGTALRSIARQIGNAVPPLLAKQIAMTIIDQLS
ncbi:DNA cytosine methyltransferase [Hymenobacter sp. 5317J-9]|uniref:DNA cytosine methyltransferase n=1 Tax=Hymenobacter sp. 5317J-9 TaxID=2932250 RepID=UPI001FD71658|nr:DNA cytosine methyltransferase [Hymenobacter sp. 5317J-9]UOQ99858.1 DNA cytosine methyltransferase [Hymenobacter sp. 5317J-9]